MAVAKKKSGKTAARTSAKAEKSVQPRSSAGKRQLMSVIWFAVAVFILCVVFIPGQNVWLAVHNAIFGVFGITAYFYPFMSAIYNI